MTLTMTLTPTLTPNPDSGTDSDTDAKRLHQAGLEGLRLLVHEQAATIEALRVEQAAQYACMHVLAHSTNLLHTSSGHRLPARVPTH